MTLLTRHTFARSPARALAGTSRPEVVEPSLVRPRAYRPTLFNGVALAGFAVYALALRGALWQVLS